MSFATGTPISDANPLPTAKVSVQDNTGRWINPDSYIQHLTYNADGNLATVWFSDGVQTWTQTLTYVAGQLSSISNWVVS
ncbi:hypothetical protein [Bradyrhizobium sp. Bra64]|uniref:hypothetical protein n=1 Tax=Bradyrhizobium sp. Bra64 TaxID=2926009 RepID=UPI002118121E|nr:hypothetical protein [Bradyrhizobium sp. Bra64]